MKFYLIIFTTALLFISSCRNKSVEEGDKNEVATEEEKPGNGATSLTDQQMKTIGVAFAKIEQKQLTASLKANGILKVPNQNKAGINSIYSGVIKSILVEPGNTVSKGQIIATVANPQFILVQSEYMGMNSKIVFAEQDFNRQKELNAGNAGALKNLQAAEAELRSLLSRKASLQQQIQLMGITPSSLNNGKLISVLPVRTPIKGVVSDVHVKMGTYVDMNTVIAEVVDNSQLHLDLYVYEKDLPKLENKQVIHFTVTNNPGREYDAQVFSLGSSFERDSKAVTVHAKVLGDKAGLIDGMNVSANISLERATRTAIPSEAIVSYQGRDYVFIADRRDTTNKRTIFKRIAIAKGTSDVGFSEVTFLEEVPTDASVVTRGAFFILAKQTNVNEHE